MQPEQRVCDIFSPPVVAWSLRRSPGGVQGLLRQARRLHDRHVGIGALERGVCGRFGSLRAGRVFQLASFPILFSHHGVAHALWWSATAVLPAGRTRGSNCENIRPSGGGPCACLCHGSAPLQWPWPWWGRSPSPAELAMLAEMIHSGPAACMARRFGPGRHTKRYGCSNCLLVGQL